MIYVLGIFYHFEYKTFCRIFSVIYNLHIAIYRYDVNEDIDVGDPVGV